MSAQQRLNEHLIAWNDVLNKQWAIALTEEAKAKADFEHAFASFKVAERLVDVKVASAWADSMAFADEKVHNLNLARRVAEATVESLRKQLNWFEARADSLRSEIASEREENRLSSSSGFTP
jgi:hypothetical protein